MEVVVVHLPDEVVGLILSALRCQAEWKRKIRLVGKDWADRYRMYDHVHHPRTAQRVDAIFHRLRRSPRLCTPAEPVAKLSTEEFCDMYTAMYRTMAVRKIERRVSREIYEAIVDLWPIHAEAMDCPGDVRVLAGMAGKIFIYCDTTYARGFGLPSLRELMVLPPLPQNRFVHAPPLFRLIDA